MANDIEQEKPAPPVAITEDIQVSLNRLGRDLETHAESGIRIGKELLYLKEITPHGKFGELVEWAYGLKIRQCQQYMKVAEIFGQNRSQLRFSNQVLIELSRPSTPDSARQEAAEHESLTVKQSKELVQAHKKLEELKAENLRLKEDQKTPAPPNTNNLIPEIKALVDSGDIMPAMGRKISTMTDEGQQVWLNIYSDKFSLENQVKEKTAKIKELESRPEPEPKIIEKEVIPLDIQDKLKKAETALAKLNMAEKEKKSFSDAYNGISEEKHKLQYEISQLKDQLKVNDPQNIDTAYAESFQDILDSLKNKLIRFEEIRISNDYPMPKTWEVLNKTMESLSAFSDRAENLVCINPIGEINNV